MHRKDKANPIKLAYQEEKTSIKVGNRFNHTSMIYSYGYLDIFHIKTHKKTL